VLAWVVNLQPDGEVPAGLTFVAMAAVLGLGTGGVFAWVGVLAPPGKVGSISGVVSAAGGLAATLRPSCWAQRTTPPPAVTQSACCCWLPPPWFCVVPRKPSRQLRPAVVLTG
jgi:nitrate/nitrite transporter NarK